MIYDFGIVGGGIVGLATAMELLRRRPGASVVLVEKESRLAAHQTGHNSGVIHAGIYYPPGSFKAELCRRGAVATKEFCSRHDVPVVTCGKLLVATTPLEHDRMKALYDRSVHNGIEVELLDAGELRRREPNITGLAAIHVASTAIVDYREVSKAMAREIEQAGAEIHCLPGAAWCEPGASVFEIHPVPRKSDKDTAAPSTRPQPRTSPSARTPVVTRMLQ